MFLKYLLAVGVLVLTFSTLSSQGIYSAGVLPQINLNISLFKDWRLNARVESRQLFSEGRFNQNFKTEFRYDLTDIVLIVSKKVNVNGTLGAGYLIRFQGNAGIHRFIQQFSTVNEYDFFRLGHRISTDQTIRKNDPVEFRFRYRISLEKAANGKNVDPKEFYFKLNNEYLFSLQDKETGLEIRLIPALGYAFNDNNKFESGIDYRLNEFISGASVSRFWWCLSWFVNM